MQRSAFLLNTAARLAPLPGTRLTARRPTRTSTAAPRRWLRAMEGAGVVPPTDPTQDTIFGKILRKEIPATVVHEDDLCLAFRDVSPQAPTHILVIPKKKIVRMADVQAEHKEVLGHMMVTAAEIARKEGLGAGYRVVVNDGPDGCQSVYHLHIHLIGGRKMSWPPG
mmetsp:Transcript_48817/g.119537  ORF Transcript_48817/g.119537 Transcript_48817/m.119537 type:complete len:167 (-) Transcript_48817:117-617(-)